MRIPNGKGGGGGELFGRLGGGGGEDYLEDLF